MGGVAGGIDPSFSESSMVIDYVRVYQNTGLSTNNVFANQFSVYPNPSNNAHTLNIRTTEQIISVTTYEHRQPCGGLLRSSQPIPRPESIETNWNN